MEHFVGEVNERWEETEATELAAFALWKINNIHPFVNGNGRTARSICYFILSVKSGGFLPGKPILPEMLRLTERDRHISLLREADAGDLKPLINFVRELMTKQITSSTS